MINEIEDELVSADVVALWLKVTPNTILNWARNGKIPVIMIGRTYRFSLKRIAESLGHEI